MNGLTHVALPDQEEALNKSGFIVADSEESDSLSQQPEALRFPRSPGPVPGGRGPARAASALQYSVAVLTVTA